jgi:hypothetical protein
MAITATLARLSQIETDIAGMTVEEYRAGLFGPIQYVPSKLSSVIVSGFSVTVAQFREGAVVTSLAMLVFSHSTFIVSSTASQTQ